MDTILQAVIGLSLAGGAWYFYRKSKQLEEALGSARVERYMLLKDLKMAGITADMYKGKVTELRSDAITKFEKVGETMTVEEAIAFTKDLSDDKN